MIEFLKKLFAAPKKLDLGQLVRDGAQIIDVRTPGEYKSGHIKGSINIPLQSLESQLNRIQKNKAVITCCASGMRSASAKSILEEKGFSQVFNGGGWQNLQRAIS